IVSDTTKNVKKCRALICAKFPWILNCPDPCHQLNLLAKDLVLGSKTFPKIKAFAITMTILNALTNYFSHSNYGKHHLKHAMKDAEDRRGIAAGGATRFSTFTTHASSVLRCLPFMQQCYQSKDSDEYDSFRRQLKQVGRLLNPIARGLQTLEGQQVTCSDVFFIWIGLAVAFQRAFNNPSEFVGCIQISRSEIIVSAESFFIDHQAESYAAFDRRFYIFMHECTPGMFILSYLLDPSMYNIFEL
ncbi:hypothetical protein B0H17DRAFT_956624, partial [Mycena rosella]